MTYATQLRTYEKQVMEIMGRCLARRHHGEVPVKKRRAHLPGRFSGGSSGGSSGGAAVASLRPCYPAPAPSTGAALLQPSVGELDPSVDEVAWAGEGEASGRWDLSAGGAEPRTAAARGRRGASPGSFAGEQRRVVARTRATRQEDLIAKVFKLLRGFL